MPIEFTAGLNLVGLVTAQDSKFTEILILTPNARNSGRRYAGPAPQARTDCAGYGANLPPTMIRNYCL